MNLRCFFGIRWLALPLLALLISLSATAQNADRYTRIKASADGIGKRYMGREIAGVMGWQGAAWLEREPRS